MIKFFNGWAQFWKKTTDKNKSKRRKHSDIHKNTLIQINRRNLKWFTIKSQSTRVMNKNK